MIKDCIEPYGEYLDIEVEGGVELYLFNITCVMDCINISQSIYEVFPEVPRGKVLKLKGEECILSGAHKKKKCHFWQPVFDADKITSNIFFVIDHRGFGHGPYCTSGFFGPEEEFYHVYHDNKLTGLLFEEVELSK